MSLRPAGVLDPLAQDRGSEDRAALHDEGNQVVEDDRFGPDAPWQAVQDVRETNRSELGRFEIDGLERIGSMERSGTKT